MKIVATGFGASAALILRVEELAPQSRVVNDVEVNSKLLVHRENKSFQFI